MQPAFLPYCHDHRSRTDRAVLNCRRYRPLSAEQQPRLHHLESERISKVPEGHAEPIPYRGWFLGPMSREASTAKTRSIQGLRSPRCSTFSVLPEFASELHEAVSIET